MIVTAERLRMLFRYDPDAGTFTRLVTLASNAQEGSVAGCVRPEGYITIMVDRRPYQAHRLVWLYVHGQWPEADLDHINRDRADNRIANLRAASRSQNNANSRRRNNNKSGFKGVSWEADRSAWRAQIRERGKNYLIGRFPSAEAAHAAYVAAAIERFGEFARAG